MLSKNQKTNVKVGSNFDPLPADKYTCQIADVTLKTRKKYNSTEDEEILNYQFIVLDDKKLPEKDGEAKSTRGRFLWHGVTQVISTKSWLGKLLKAVYGRDLTKEEKESLDVESIVGKQVGVMTEQVESKSGDIYTNIISYVPVTEQLEKVEFTPKDKDDIPFEEKSSVPVNAPSTGDVDKFTESLDEESKPESIAEIEAKLAAAKAAADKATSKV